MQISIDLNGKNLSTIDMVAQREYKVRISPEDILPGENVFNFRNNLPNSYDAFLRIDYFSFEPLRPANGMVLMIK